MTKTQDQLLFAFYNKNDGTRVTDLHQGIVWGTQTAETRLDERLINRFDYDGDYGTVLNRFLMQAAIGYPLTVHGTGGQTRAFIHIQDTVRCIQLAIENPPERGDRVQVFNQMTETHRVRDLAKLVAELTGAEIDYVENPRKEAAENELFVANDHLLELGLDPITLRDDLLTEVTEIAQKYADRCDRVEDPLRLEVDPDQAPDAGRAGQRLSARALRLPAGAIGGFVTVAISGQIARHAVSTPARSSSTAGSPRGRRSPASSAGRWRSRGGCARSILSAT